MKSYKVKCFYDYDDSGGDDIVEVEVYVKLKLFCMFFCFFVVFFENIEIFGRVCVSEKWE